LSEDFNQHGQNTGQLKEKVAGNITTQRWLIPVLVALIGAFMSILDSSIVNVAITTIMKVFNATPNSAQWVVTIYMLAMGVVVPLSGWLGDKLGFKRLYILSMAVFVIGSALCTISWSIDSLIFARIIQAVGGGMIMPTTMAMVFRIVPKDRIGGGMSILGIALMVAPAIGPTLGGYLVEYIDWRWIFTINIPVGLIGILLSIYLLPEFPKIEAGKLDIGGAITSATGLFCLLLALSKGADWGWSSQTIILLFYICAVSFALFIYLEMTTKNPLLDLRVFKYSTFTLANLIIVVTTVGLYTGLFYIPLFMQSVRGMGAMETGLLMMPGALASGIMMPISGRIYDRVGPKALISCGVVFMAYMTYMFHNLTLETSTTTIITWLVLRGIVMTLVNMPAQTAAMAAVPLELVGRASAMTNIVNRVSSSFSIAVLTSILTKREIMYNAHMSSHFTSWNISLAAFFQKSASYMGVSGGFGKTLSSIYLKEIVARVAFVKGIDDVFIIAGAFTLIGLIPALFLKRVNTVEVQSIGE
jgi:EmrB/QacA subfamily drug resistance transporter